MQVQVQVQAPLAHLQQVKQEDMDEDEEEDSDEDEDGVTITIDQDKLIQANKSSAYQQLKPTDLDAIATATANATATPEKLGRRRGVFNSLQDFDDQAPLNQTAFVEDKPWKKPGADITDYFNYGFCEETWSAYCNRQRRFRVQDSKVGLPVAGVGGAGHHGFEVKAAMTQPISAVRTNLSKPQHARFRINLELNTENTPPPLLPTPAPTPISVLTRDETVRFGRKIIPFPVNLNNNNLLDFSHPPPMGAFMQDLTVFDRPPPKLEPVSADDPFCQGETQFDDTMSVVGLEPTMESQWEAPPYMSARDMAASADPPALNLKVEPPEEHGDGEEFRPRVPRSGSKCDEFVPGFKRRRIGSGGGDGRSRSYSPETRSRNRSGRGFESKRHRK